MPAEVEEVVVGADGGEAEHSGEQLAHQVLARVALGPLHAQRGGGLLGGGQRLAVDLAVGVSGIAGSATIAAGTM